MGTEQQSDNTLQITRIIAAPPHKVFDAWIDPAVRMQWWCASPQMTCDFCEIDARVGGRYRINMKGPGPGATSPEDRKEYIACGTFEQIDRPRRLAFTWRWETWRESHVDSLVTLDFSPVAGGTRLTLTQTLLPDANAVKEHVQGWNGCLDCLAKVLSEAVRT